MSKRVVGAWCGGLALALTIAGCTIYTTPPDEPAPARPRRPARAHRPPPRPAPPPAPAHAAHDGDEPEPASTEALPPQPPRDAPPTTRTRAELLPEGVGTGRPKGFKPGAPAAYWIWQGPRGDWRIRTTTNKLLHTFRGYAEGTSSAVANVHPSRNELRDQVWRVHGGAWAFAFATMGHADGFTFAVRENGCVRFDLALDGGPHPKRIFVGKDEVQPSSSHFIVCPKGKKPEGRARPREEVKDKPHDGPASEVSPVPPASAPLPDRGPPPARSIGEGPRSPSPGPPPRGPAPHRAPPPRAPTPR